MYAEATQPAYVEDESYAPQKKKKKIGFIKRWFAKMSQEVWEEARHGNSIRAANDIVGMKQARISASPVSIDQPERAIQFTVYSANGGRVVETRRYDRHKDRSQTGLYIITGEQDFGKEIDKIITMETLKS
jgi:hypothetical protein